MVTWSFDARQNLKEIHDHIARDSKVYAQRVVDEMVARSMQLDDMPRRYRMMPELGDDAVREFSIYSYRVIFEIMADHIAVLAVVHKRRDIASDDIKRT
ncbi:MAG: type II toxin-antitoxin system RelE/ParE family toxin [Roseovarius sp.]